MPDGFGWSDANGAMGAGRGSLAANARPFRYGFYPVVGAGFLLFEEPGFAHAAAVACWCALWPPVADFIARRGGVRLNLRLHLAEVALACFLFATWGLSQALLQAVCIILVMSNALQGGLPQAAKTVACGAPALAGGLVVGGAPALPEPSSVFAGLLLLAYCMLIAHVAFARVLATHGDRARARALNARLQKYLPHTLARRVGGNERPRLERRWLVIVFADLAGFTALVERLQMEEVATMLDGYLQCVSGVTRRWGGALSKVLGDGALLVFGEEGDRTRGQLVAHALGCCGELTGELEKLTNDWRGRGLPGSARVKTGVASGYCSLGDWGGGERLEYTVIGHPVNLASRLQDLAAAGETLLCERTSLLAEVPLSPVARRPVKGLGDVSFRKIEKRPDAGAPPARTVR